VRGQTDNVTFLQGLVFYGMADSKIGLAEHRPWP
jgi:hypothetical protein